MAILLLSDLQDSLSVSKNDTESRVLSALLDIDS